MTIKVQRLIVLHILDVCMSTPTTSEHTHMVSPTIRKKNTKKELDKMRCMRSQKHRRVHITYRCSKVQQSPTHTIYTHIHARTLMCTQCVYIHIHINVCILCAYIGAAILIFLIFFYVLFNLNWQGKRSHTHHTPTTQTLSL